MILLLGMVLLIKGIVFIVLILQRIADEGIEAFYEGEIPEAIVAAVNAEPNPGSLTVEDIAGYRAIKREPVCGPFRDMQICSASPPS